MKLSAAVLLAAVSLTYASPLRVVVTSHQEVTSGDVTVHNVAAQVYPSPPGMPKMGTGRKPCHNGKTDDSLIEKGRVWIMGIMGHGPVVNHAALPEVVGPSDEFMKNYRKPISPSHMHIEHHTNAEAATFATEADGQDNVRLSHDISDQESGQELKGRPFRGHHHDFAPVHIMHMGMSHRHRRGSFLRRMHFALMALGPWEGRAVAFVLGCGIGVLLRMLFVLSVVLYRITRGTPSSEPETEDYYVEEQLPIILFDADNMPPAYSEKAPLVAAEEKSEEKPEEQIEQEETAQV